MKRIAYIFLGFLLLAADAAETAQIVLVTSADMQHSTGMLRRFEKVEGTWHAVGVPVAVNLGRNGMGWGEGTLTLSYRSEDPEKREGDGRAPAGVFTFGTLFGEEASFAGAMPYRRSGDDLICADDDAAPAYNRLVHVREAGSIRSFEWMRRPDGLYRYGIVVNHNVRALPGHGSCIFMHIQSAPGAPTSGCTSMDAPALRTVLAWLKPEAEPLLIQIPDDMLPEIERRFTLPLR